MFFLIKRKRFLSIYSRNIDFNIQFSNRSNWFIATRYQYEILEKRKLQKSNSVESAIFLFDRKRFMKKKKH